MKKMMKMHLACGNKIFALRWGCIAGDNNWQEEAR